MTGVGRPAPFVFTASAAYFEFAENVFVGPLSSVDPDAGTFKVGGVTVRMSDDPRTRQDVVDLNGDEITDLHTLIGWEGTAVGAEGFFESGELRGTFVETEVIPTTAGEDSVAIERAQFRSSKNQVDVRGQVTPIPGQTAVVGTVSIDVRCDSVVDNTATVTLDPATGLGDWRWITTNNAFADVDGPPVKDVCVSSPNGGQARTTFAVRN